MKILVYLFFILNFSQLFANDNISFGTVEIGDERLKLHLEDFQINTNLPKHTQPKIEFRKKSVDWIRIHDVLLTPRARIAIHLKGNSKNYHVTYNDHSILMQKDGKYAHTEFYVSLFQPLPIKVFYKGKKIGDINIDAHKRRTTKNTQVIDYTCSRNGITVKGMKGEYISLGCKMHRIGDLMEEKPMLEIYWTSANYKLLDQSKSPYVAVLFNNKPVEMTVVNRFGEKRVIEISARLPKNLKRGFTAVGLGPNVFNTSNRDPNADEEDWNKESISPAFFMYFNFKLDDEYSIRGFDALTVSESVFNNAGVYYAYDIASILDNRVVMTALIGFQAIYYKFDDDSPVKNEIIGPQGFEAVWKHAFDITNYTIGYGMFVDPSSTYDYNNTWIRWGKGYFWELNYISYATGNLDSKMYGVSIAWPFMAFF